MTSTSPSAMDPAMPYHFDDAARSIVMHDPVLPSPWINYLSNGSLHAFTSQAGGGSLWWRSPINFRITRYRGWTATGDGPGFYLYVRSSDGAIWSPSARPCDTKPYTWSATHAPGVTRFQGRRDDLEVTLELFIAPDCDDMIWDITATNHGKEALEIDLTGYAELGLLEYPLEASWGYYVRHQFKTWFDAGNQAQLYLFHHESHPRLSDVPLVYFASDRAVASASGDRAGFMGRGRDERLPLGVERRDCGGGSASGGDPCAALHTRLRIAPGAREHLAYHLGVVPGALADFSGAMRKLGDRLSQVRAPGFTTTQRARQEAWWAEHFAAFDCRLPDQDCERQIRTWTPVNCVHTGRFSRSFSQYASGLRGFGFRDTAQDMMALASRRPDWARAEFLRLLRHQFSDGHAVHTYFPEDNQPPSRSIHSDDHLWLPMLAHALLAETGDLGLLAQEVPFLAEDGRSAGQAAPVWEHLLAALRFTETHLGTHGLPLILASDWNDCIGRFSRAGRGESSMAAMQYVLVLRQMLELAAMTGYTADAQVLQQSLKRQSAAIATHCWDGEWWRRGFDDAGEPIGSHTCAHGRIWLNAQTWAVLADCGEPAQQQAGMDAAARWLETPHGLTKLHPGFPTFPETSDAFSGYSPGAGENGAIFCHANTWAVIAEASLGRADRAWSYFRRLVPHLALQQVGLERYQGEPYAYASSILGPENPRFGQATLTHVTGTAAWMDIAAVQHLLGIQPTIRGLRLAPRLPTGWPGYTATRIYRGCHLEIAVTRASGGTLHVDGRERAGDIIDPSWIAGRPKARIELK